MHIRSLGLSTELQLAATRSQLTDRGDYIVVVTPEEPGYFFGNLLVLPAAPQVGEVAYWIRRFTDEMRGEPAVRHVAFRWDGITGELGARDELVAAGFTLEVHAVMTAPQVTAGSIAFDVRPLRPDELHATGELAYAIGDQHDERYRHFLQRRATWGRQLVTRGIAQFWGAFDGAQLVASLGLVPLGRVARYQDVQTAASHRKQGIAGALLAAAAAAVRDAGVETFVIVAEPDSDAARVYARAGFTTVERTASAWRQPFAGS
ncbi:MAG: GNAT family N-acetyltransferase [Myxococcota bacterium]|nr:GNAT family N-acetyltransferase [Myxococcota bacterium]